MLNIIILMILIAINAFFAAAEIAFISLNDAKISKLAKDGDKKAKQIEKMLKEPSKFLATIQIGVTLAGFLSSAFAATSISIKIAPMLQNSFPIGIEFWTNISIIIVTMMLAYITLIFGELVPKRVAMKNYEKIAYATVGIIKGIYTVTLPFVKLLTFSTNIVSKIFGVSEQDSEEVTEEEIRMMVDVGEEAGNIEQNEKEMINNIFEFNDKTVSEVMIHRKDIMAVDISTKIDELIEIVYDNMYSRLPVYKDNIDEIVGILYTKELIKPIRENKRINIKNIIRKPYFVSENKKINDLFKEMQRSKVQVAIVLDEYGGTAGIITMEDILEEIVGNIFDEFDDIEYDYEKIDETTYRFNGLIPIYEVEKILEIKIPEGDYDTLSGYLIEELGRIPSDKEKPIIETEEVSYKIEQYEDRRIVWVKACKNNIEKTAEEEN